MKFVILMKQEGEGCDYTIACGQKYCFIEAADMEEALYRVRAASLDSSCKDFEISCDFEEMKEVFIVEVGHVVNALKIKSKKEILDDLKAKRAKEEKARLKRLQDNADKESLDQREYERLKKKFGESK